MWPFKEKLIINLYLDNSQSPKKVVYQRFTPQANLEIPLGDLGRQSQQTSALINFLNKQGLCSKRICLVSSIPEQPNYSPLSQGYLEIIARQLNNITGIDVKLII